MSHNVDEVMWAPSYLNLIIQMWLKIQSSQLLVLKLCEYMKVVEIVMVQVLGLLRIKGPSTT
jgi:hypothetical protein